MNIVNILIAEGTSNNRKGSLTLALKPGQYHVFDHTGEYVDYLPLKNVSSEYMAILQAKYKRCIIISGHAHKDEWRLGWTYVNDSGSVTSGTDTDADYTDWTRAISPTTRKPWYWERKISKLKTEFPLWETDVQEAASMRFECRYLLDELETHFNINNNYYRIQNQAALDAHSVIMQCDSVIDQFEYEMAHMDRILDERESTNWTDEREDLHM